MYPRRTADPKLNGCFGAIFLLMGILIIVIYRNDLKKMPDQPLPLQLASLNEQINRTSTRWVKLEGGHWACESIQVVYAGRSTDTKALYVGDGNIAVYAIFSEKLSCEALARQPATGSIRNINEKYLASIKQENPVVAQLPDNTVIYELCGYCGPSNSRAGISVGCFMIACSLVIILCSRQAFQGRATQIYGRWKY